MGSSIGVGLIGLGTVGSGVVRLLRDAPAAMQRRQHLDLQLRRIAVADPAKKRAVDVAADLLTANAMDVVDDPDVQLVVELSGAAGAREWIAAGLERGKDVVTANKAVLAQHGEELFGLALANGVDLMFEASVAGGIPIIRSLRSGLVANEVESLYGILNGTTNYILTRMTRREGGYREILADAQEKGFAEPDPSMDVSGMDAAQKLAILCRIAFHTTGTGGDVYCEGIEQVDTLDIEYARELGFTIKLLAIAKRGPGGVQARVHPAMLPSESLLANIHDEFNAIEVVGSSVGTQVFSGRGAGQMPTASAVVADMVELAERKISGAGSAGGDMILDDGAASLADMSELEIRYYLRLLVEDRPGVLESITHIVAQGDISIASVIQKERDLQGGTVPLIIVTHEARERSMRQAVAAMNALDGVHEEVTMIRMEKL
ncbi:MAG: homoserine dehydrogenase [Candidatus Latescibacterota bacterium]|nr:homoserine dehydrogenase [Candidatus Latescibacterota bacterium]